MHQRFILLSLICLPLVALAQVNRAASPLLVVNPQQPAGAPAAATPAPLAPSFPDWAVTKVGDNPGAANPGGIPYAPNVPISAAPAAPQNAAAAAVPQAPAAPVSKLWPRDTIPLFLPSCTGFHPEMVQPCTCIITRLMTAMGHDEFLFKSEAGTIESDPRLIAIRNECAQAPRQRQ
ncbi:MAG: hypothetical protein ACKVOE_04730 [Rickettsiales bacterium]